MSEVVVSTAEIGRDLVSVLRVPARLGDLSAPRLDSVLRLARRTSTLPRLALGFLPFESTVSIDPRARSLLQAARATADHHRRNILWEADRIARALEPLGIRVIALKGAAYELAGLPPRIGRMSSDFDILVPEERLGGVERALERAGWRTDCEDPYDQRYYRKWMHELPPLRHEGRGTLVDVHHTLVPRTSREVRPDVAALWRAASPIEGFRYEILSPEDLVLHSAVHAFHDGDLSEPFRDLVDLDGLLRHFGRDDGGFWDRLVRSAEMHRAGVPLFYALRYTSRTLGTPTPASVRRIVQRWAPSPGIVVWMDRLLDRVTLPAIDGPAPVAVTASASALFIRAHALRMPIGQLAVHLGRKGWRRLRNRDDDPEL